MAERTIERADLDGLLAKVRDGYPWPIACEAIGIRPATGTYWRNRGNQNIKDHEAGICPIDDYGLFYLEWKKARADLAGKHIAKIRGAKDWRAHAWTLERLFPREFGQYRSTERPKIVEAAAPASTGLTAEQAADLESRFLGGATK